MRPIKLHEFKNKLVIGPPKKDRKQSIKKQKQ